MPGTTTNRTEEKLIEDIKEFIPMFGRKASAAEVLEWSWGIYRHYPGRTKTTPWARRLIRAATSGNPYTTSQRRARAP